jgi:hypothetical protein
MVRERAKGVGGVEGGREERKQNKTGSVCIM